MVGSEVAVLVTVKRRSDEPGARWSRRLSTATLTEWGRVYRLPPLDPDESAPGDGNSGHGRPSTRQLRGDRSTPMWSVSVAPEVTTGLGQQPPHAPPLAPRDGEWRYLINEKIRRESEFEDPHGPTDDEAVRWYDVPSARRIADFNRGVDGSAEVPDGQRAGIPAADDYVAIM